MASIQHKIMIASLAIFALSGGATGVGVWSATVLTQNSTEVVHSAQVLRNHMQADMMHDALRADVLASILASDPEAGIPFNEVKAALTEHETSFRDMIAANKSLANDPVTQNVLAGVEPPLLVYIDSASKMVDLAGKDSAAALKALPDFMKQFSALEKAMGDAGDQIQAVSVSVSEKSTATQQIIATLLKIILGVTAAFSIGLFLISRRSITKPMLALANDMKMLADGETAIACTGIGRSDEIGSMAASVEVFRQAAITNRQMELDAETTRQRADANQIAARKEAEENASARLRVATSGLAAGLKRLAGGDLAFQLDEAFAPDFEILRLDFNSSVSQLGDTMSAISNGIAAIDSGTREISSGANDLSKRTEQQAASLEQTAAALDEITANVSNSSKRTEEARAAATEANLSAAKSAEVVSHAEEAMERIEASSQQISNIIGVIDEIGEAGKGFAVVAQEVRELAQRSAQAAKQIKGLIQNSSIEVDSGVKLVRETKIALQTIGEQIIGINKHMESIATSASEQSTGLAEVNTAVNSMDQTTQQNAAMVEESTAASATLAMEAAKLREHVSQFSLKTSTAQSTALRSAAKAMKAPASHAAPSNNVPTQRKTAAYAGASRAPAQDNWEEF